jgi:hypothetical protein
LGELILIRANKEQIVMRDLLRVDQLGIGRAGPRGMPAHDGDDGFDGHDGCDGDIGMRFMLLGKRNTDAGHILENVVYLELLRRGYDVYVGKVDSFEVDFVAMNGNNTFYYQVALSVRDADTLQRELRPLLSIRDHYPKYILTMDDDPEEQYDGIRRINARDWLLGLTD